MKEIVILDPSFRRMANILTPYDLQRLRDVAEILWARDEPMPEAEIEAVREQVAIIITGQWRYGEVSRFPKLRAIMEVSGGFPSPQALDYGYCFAHSIRVLSCAPAFGPAVAEMGLGLAISAARQIGWTDRAFRTGEPHWSHTAFDTEIGTPFTLYDKQVGFIGYGGLAHALQPLLAPFRCRIQAYDPWLTETHLRKQGVTPVDLDTLLATSKVIFVLAVPSASNRALLDRDKLSLICPDAVFVLLSRSHVVDFDALTEMVLAGCFRAAIDVYPQEPLPKDHPIRQAQYAVLTSHRAGAIGEAIQNIGRIVADDLEALCQGKMPHAMQVAQPEFIRARG